MDINNENRRLGTSRIFDNCISEEKRYLSVKSLARYLDVSEYTIRKWIDHRKIPFVRINASNTIRFDLYEIVRWVSPV